MRRFFFYGMATQMLHKMAARAFNTPFRIDADRRAIVFYSVQIKVTASIGGGQDGEVFLECAANAAFTDDVQQLAVIGNAQTFSLAVALQGVQTLTAALSGFIPAGYYVRLRTVNNVGVPVYTLRIAQEVLA